MMRQQGENQPDPFKDLTERELDVLRLLAEGKGNVDIAEALVLSDKTVRNHVSIILDKLNVRNRVAAATYAIEHDIRNYQNSDK
jgi:DNA-binding NarL/FixJ family response regulator